MEQPPLPTTTSTSSDIVRELRGHLENDDAFFGERLMMLGEPLAPIGGPLLIALDAAGATVAIAPLETLNRSTAARLAEEMDRLRHSSPSDLQRRVGAPDEEAWIENKHASWTGASPQRINDSQRLIVIVPQEPSITSWRVLREELGTQLNDVHVYREGALHPVPPPPLEPQTIPSQQARSRSGLPGGRSPMMWLGILALVLGVGLILLGVAAALFNEEDAAEPQQTFIQAPIRTVASGVEATATFTNWSGQQRIVRVGDNRLLVLFMGSRGLEIVADERNQGRTWRSAVRVPGITADSFSVAADGKGRLHLALSDEGGLQYVRLERSSTGWVPGEILDLTDAATEVVNIVWDAASGTAHVVWAEDSPSGERPYWAAVSPGDGSPSILKERPFAEPGGEASVLAALGSFGDGRLITTYRNANDASWYSRIGAPDELGEFAWEPQEALPMEGFAGAVSLAIDEDRVAHLVLRDDTNTRITYFRRQDPGGWSGGETAVDATSSDEIDLPTLAVDTTSRLVFVFFVNNAEEGATPQVAIRDPATRWEGPDAIAGTGEIGRRGAAHPTTMGRSEGQPIVIWTTQGAQPEIQSARISAP
jgi:hypothetical protein